MKLNYKSYLAVFFVSLLLFCASFPVFAMGQDELTQEDYNRILEQYDLSAFDELDNSSKELLDELGLTDFDYSTIVDFSISDFYLL